MASAPISPAASAVVGYSTFDALRLDRSKQDSAIHCFIPANRANHYMTFLNVGSIIKLDRFEVARVGHIYKITEHQFVVRFTPATSIVEIPTGGPTIGSEKFMVRSYDHLQILANTNLELSDVVGQIRSIQRSDLTNESATARIVVRLLIKPLYLNSTPTTRFFFDTNLPGITEFIGSLGDSASQVYPCVDTLVGIQKKELVSIGDLNTFISNSNEQNQEADFLCKARIIDVLQQNRWSFVSCTKCNKKLEKNGTSLFCNKCATNDVTRVVRFCVELDVDDGKDSDTFVVFDREMTKVTKEQVAVLAMAENLIDVEEELPACLEELIGKEYVFQIRVTPFNFTPNHRTFTVSTMIKDTSIEAHTKEPGEDILASIGGGEIISGSSSGVFATGDKVGGEGVAGTLSVTEVTDNSRKRLRE